MGVSEHFLRNFPFVFNFILCIFFQEQESEQLVPEVENGNAKLNGSALNGTIVEDLNVSVKPAPTTGPKFGWIKGVLVSM